ALLGLLGTAIYASAVASVGYALASSWTRIEHDISIASYIIVAVVLVAVAAFFVHRIREVRKEGQENHQDPVRDPVA
ncbi:MAG TPA: hypothetical protein VHY58_05490, partial [Streptosporangiaceae bacterium]|nr:hypothetical protein [Streptosporangiaceae bacterium]